eukprot:2263169-Rhodomonas_salina.1
MNIRRLGRLGLGEAGEGTAENKMYYKQAWAHLEIFYLVYCIDETKFPWRKVNTREEPVKIVHGQELET